MSRVKQRETAEEAVRQNELYLKFGEKKKTQSYRWYLL